VVRNILRMMAGQAIEPGYDGYACRQGEAQSTVRLRQLSMSKPANGERSLLRSERFPVTSRKFPVLSRREFRRNQLIYGAENGLSSRFWD